MSRVRAERSQCAIAAVPHPLLGRLALLRCPLRENGSRSSATSSPLPSLRSSATGSLIKPNASCARPSTASEGAPVLLRAGEQQPRW